MMNMNGPRPASYVSGSGGLTMGNIVLECIVAIQMAVGSPHRFTPYVSVMGWGVVLFIIVKFL